MVLKESNKAITKNVDKEDKIQLKNMEINFKVKGKSYILDGSDVYIKKDNGEKGNHYGIYFSNTGKVKKILFKFFNLYVYIKYI